MSSSSGATVSIYALAVVSGNVRHGGEPVPPPALVCALTFTRCVGTGRLQHPTGSGKDIQAEAERGRQFAERAGWWDGSFDGAWFIADALSGGPVAPEGKSMGLALALGLAKLASLRGQPQRNRAPIECCDLTGIAAMGELEANDPSHLLRIGPVGWVRHKVDHLKAHARKLDVRALLVPALQRDLSETEIRDHGRLRVIRVGTVVDAITEVSRAHSATLLTI